MKLEQVIGNLSMYSSTSNEPLDVLKRAVGFADIAKVRRADAARGPNAVTPG
jgi:hypothetical protein